MIVTVFPFKLHRLGHKVFAYLVVNVGLMSLTQLVASRHSKHLPILDEMGTCLVSRSKLLSLSWLQSPSAVVLEPQKESLTLDQLFPNTSWEIDGETVETLSDFIFLAPKPLQMVTAAMKLKDAYSLEGKL